MALVTSFGTGYFTGHSHGVDSQKVADQFSIDKVNAKIEENKRIANAEMANAQQAVIELQAEREKFKTKIEQERQTNVETTNKLHDAYAAYSLRFRSDDQRSWCGGENSVPATGTASGDNGTSVCVISDETSKSLRNIAYEADQLRDDYRLLYDWAHKP